MTLHADNSPPLIPFARLIDQRRISRAGDGSTVQVEFDVTEDWAQGRTAFGGLTSAFGLQAMRDLQPGATGPFVLRALQTSFVGPVTVGSVTADVVLLRQGRNVRQLQATLHQHGEVAAVLLGVFAQARESSMRTQLLRRPEPSCAPDELPPRVRAGAAPQFLRHFDMRWDHGPQPGSSDPGLATRIHMRMVDGDGLDDEMLTVLFADVSPTPATGQFSQRPPASSVSWALELRPLRDPTPRDGWWRADNESLLVDDGYVNHAARIWAPSGELAALAYQVVAIFG
ncbi:thioesterase family protein [Piscinibacter sakaiensis]|uniref:thioesterase family protein n=1 Tax=Piscinibacter sakaiensis TaxID=1547922 RepID=UPI003AAD665B